VAVLQAEAGTAPCAQTLTRINESLQARERLLTATARASRLLLEAPDVRAAIPDVLGLIGEAARVDRLNLMRTRTRPRGERLLAVVSEWTAGQGSLTPPAAPAQTCDEACYTSVLSELRAGRSVCSSKVKAIVPIFVAGEFTGVVEFDNTSQHRAIDA